MATMHPKGVSLFRDAKSNPPVTSAEQPNRYKLLATCAGRKEGQHNEQGGSWQPVKPRFLITITDSNPTVSQETGIQQD